MRPTFGTWSRIYGRHMVESSRPWGRVDVQIGAGRRRRWSDEAKGRIVAESYAAGAVVSEVARRHDISAQHLSLAKADAGLAEPAGRRGPVFVPVVTDRRAPVNSTSNGTAASQAASSSGSSRMV